MKLPEYPRLHPRTVLQPLDAAGPASTFLLISPAGKRWQIPESHYRFLLLLDGTRPLAKLQDEINERPYEGISGCDVSEVVDRLAWSNGLLVAADGLTLRPESAQRSPFRLKLLFSIPLIHTDRLRLFANPLRRAYNVKFAVFALSAGAVVLGIFSLVLKSRLQSQQTTLRSCEFVAVMVIALFAFPFHELGHLSACRHFGIAAGKLGLGFYWLFPVIYTDLSLTWNLPRKQRAVIDLGGIYFGFLGAVMLAGAYVVTHYFPFAGLSFFYLTINAINLNPLIKLDGYWFLSDRMGIPNLHQAARAAIWRQVTQGFGWKKKVRPAYVGWRETFLEIFGSIHLLFLAGIWMLIVRFLPQAYATLRPDHLKAFIAIVANASLTSSWWIRFQPQFSAFLISVGCLVMMAGLTLQAVTRLLSMIHALWLLQRKKSNSNMALRCSANPENSKRGNSWRFQ